LVASAAQQESASFVWERSGDPAVIAFQFDFFNKTSARVPAVLIL
jgi:hypothetical protein